MNNRKALDAQEAMQHMEPGQWVAIYGEDLVRFAVRHTDPAFTSYLWSIMNLGDTVRRAHVAILNAARAFEKTVGKGDETKGAKILEGGRMAETQANTVAACAFYRVAVNAMSSIVRAMSVSLSAADVDKSTQVIN